jgi:sortase A
MIGIRRTIRSVGTVAICAGLMALLYVGWGVARTRAPEFPHLSHSPSAWPTASAATPRALVAGESLGQIRIERLGLAAEIREGESAAVLRRGVGHLADTAWLGQGGNVALAGHRDTVFRALRKIKPGDVIEIATPGRIAQYLVAETTVVAPDDLSVLESSGDSTLTLITCYPFTFIGAAPNRFVVRARETNPPRASGRD